MVPPDDGPADARPPRLTDLVALCRRLNEEGALYVIIGGMAIIQAGFVRATEDIDLLVDTSPENITRLRQALVSLPDRAVEEMADEPISGIGQPAAGAGPRSLTPRSGPRRSGETANPP